MNLETAKSKLCVALDVPDAESAVRVAAQLQSSVGMFKVGMELYNAEGPSVVKRILNLGAKVFLDLKFHDIPNTVASTSRVVGEFGVSMFNVHASGGIEMMKAAAQASCESSARLGLPAPKVIGVTVLTSIDDQCLGEIIGKPVSVTEHVRHLALMAQDAGLDGVVASPHEIAMLRQCCPSTFMIVCPGIRPSGSAKEDQKRIATPKGAIQNGADIIVVGRPITRADCPLDAAQSILQEICECK